MTADPLSLYYDLTFRVPRDNALTWLNDLSDTFGDERLCEALTTEWALSQDLRTFLSRTAGRLQLAQRKAEAKQEARHRDREMERQREYEAMPLEMRQANLHRLREMLREAGLPKEIRR